MANLMDIIRGNSQAQQPGMTDETQKLQTLLRAKSGKSLGDSSPVASSLGEQAAISQASQQIQQQVQPQAQLQQVKLQQQAQGQEQQFQQQSQQIAQQRRFDDARTQIQMNATLNELERNKGQLDQDKYKSDVAQVAQTLRLQNQQYIDNLQREGNTARLNDALSFKEEFAKAAMENNKELAGSAQANKAILAADQREFNKMIGDMEMSSAYDAFRNELSGARTQAVIGALSGGAKAGIAASKSTPEEEK